MLKLALAASTALVTMTAAAQANTVIALTGDNTLSAIDATTWEVTGTMDVTGYDGRLVGIDVRPADGMLYGVGTDGTIVTIDTSSGEATEVSTLSQMLEGAENAVVDFNPAADRLRLMSTDGTNFRVNVDTGEVVVDGELAYAEEAELGVVAGAYTNSYAGTEATQLYNVDTANGWLVLQDPPNDGVLNPVGELGVSADWAAFDILSDGQGGNSAWMMAGGTLYEVDLETGAASEVGAVGVDGDVRDIAIIPAM